MKHVTVDVETFWAPDYSLDKLPPLEYCRDPRFELISVSLKEADGPTQVFFGAEAERVLRETDWSDTFLVAHNMSGFDAYVLALLYGVRPRLWGDTLAMARPIYGRTIGLSLGSLVKHLGIGRKDGEILLRTRGKRLADFTQEEIDQMRRYNASDTDQCYDLFQHLRQFYTAEELWQIDTVVRMRIEPMFELDRQLLEQTLVQERERKRKSLHQLAEQLNLPIPDDGEDPAEAVRSMLASAPKFAKLLEQLGVEVPMKPSPRDPAKHIPALAKSDEAFLALRDDPNPLVSAAVEARLGVKSTLLETRIEAFLRAGELMDGRLPIPLRYCGAITGRDSGDEYNPQNLPRINKNKPQLTDSLRRSLRAPEGYVVLVADQSQIELRVNHFLWQVEESMQLFAENPQADLYRAFGATLFGCKPEEVTSEQRQVSKVAQLGLGFGAGPKTFRRVAKIQGGIDLPVEAPDGVLSCKVVVTAWRGKYKAIKNGWYRCHDMLDYIANGVEGTHIDPWGLCKTHREGILLPSGRLIRYPDLRRVLDEDTGEVEWCYGTGKNTRRIYAGKIDENIVQALARDSIFDAAVQFFRLTGLRPSLRVHDELVYVVRKAEAPKLLEQLQRILRTPPRWWPELVVWSEGSTADCYGDAK